MFKTPINAEVQYYGLFGKGFRHWRISMHSFQPWFHVILATQNEDTETLQSVMVNDATTLEQLLSQLQSHERLESLQVVTPDWVNQAGRWLMEPLESLLVGKSSLGRPAYVYRLSSGATYLFGVDEREGEADLHALRQIYPSPGSCSREVH